MSVLLDAAPAPPTALPTALPTILYHVPLQLSVDGNTVEVDIERAKFARNAVMYEFSAQRALGEYRELAELFKKLT